jgi:hypothetical protein
MLCFNNLELALRMFYNGISTVETKELTFQPSMLSIGNQRRLV